MEKEWKKYLDTDFGTIEEDQFHADGYVYYAEDGTDTPYRLIQFSFCYIPLDKRNDEEFVGDTEAECKQYIEDCSEEKARETIEWYLANCEQL